MTFSRRRPLLVLPAVAVLAAAGCSSSDATAKVAVPSPPAKEAAACTALDGLLPDTVARQKRHDPTPNSPLTARWGDGDAEIVLRCGIPRPEEMSDPTLPGIGVGGVDWTVQKRDQGPRFITQYRDPYVEILTGTRYTNDASLLQAFATPVDEAIPKTV
ncbi:DUF3515 domain-containing protein [Streptomyces sp. ASQP_92]|uniref:DUF3515 domain-containing protein n=1 Tax=Streptomyces sp. ASQP_92 TaxID=2979116 RepID=UPI0021BECD9A|nr:DUF3515 domain-containing protein [Streptomyces sp. ASQP_92]MCT9093645.1 DUF3515 domain-containing protein [Streptomyces sp. ASQP_92]